MIAYSFPPAGEVGVYRPLKFVKYLSDFGWQSQVLTVKNGKFSSYDDRLLELIPDHVPVHRARSFELLNLDHRWGKLAGDGRRRSFWTRVRTRLAVVWAYLTIPDNKITWVPFAALKAIRLIKSEKIDRVYVTAKPFSSFLIAGLIKRFTRAKVLLDYRDPWTRNVTYHHRSAVHTWIEKRLERKAVHWGDVLIANTRTNREWMIEEFGHGQSPEKFVTIHNGFDPADFEVAAPGSYEKFTITYAGDFYYSVGSDYKSQAGNDVMRTYSPLFFLDALQQLFERRPEIKANLQVNFMGRLGHGYNPIIAEKGLDAVVQVLGYLDYDEHIAVLKRSHALLLVLSRGKISRGWIPSKFFQYLGSGNPIIALVPEGEVRTIIGETRSGVWVEPDDVPAIANAIEMMYDKHYVDKQPFERNEQEVAKYERSHLTQLLARFLEQA